MQCGLCILILVEDCSIVGPYLVSDKSPCIMTTYFASEFRRISFGDRSPRTRNYTKSESDQRGCFCKRFYLGFAKPFFKLQVMWQNLFKNTSNSYTVFEITKWTIKLRYHTLNKLYLLPYFQNWIFRLNFKVRLPLFQSTLYYYCNKGDDEL